MTISELIDYLNQFPPETRVFLNDQEATRFDGNFISLDILYGLLSGEDK